MNRYVFHPTDARPGLFPKILGAGFAALAPAVRAVHGGGTLELRGTGTITRGHSPVARLMCWVARLPGAQQNAPLRVVIEAHDACEVWSRRFGSSPVMQSVLRQRGEYLVERLGPLALWFNLSVDRGAVLWRPARARVLGVPIPPRWLAQITARAGEERGRYRFDVEVAIPGFGLVIGYSGHLDPVRQAGSASPLN